MKKRIFFFQATTLLVALVALLFVSAIVIQAVLSAYRKSITSADQQISSVQEILMDWGYSLNWYALDQALQQYQCGLVVEYGGKVLYSSLDPFQKEQYARVSETATWPENGVLALQDQGILMIGRQIGGVLTFVAVGEPVTPLFFGERRFQEEAVALALVTSGLAAIGVIILLSLFFTRYQVRLIMQPVNELTAAAKRVSEGDLTTSISYTDEDEFTAVCTAFDEMQHSLLEEKQKNATYERARADLVAGISHDLRTPLTSVKGYIQGIRDGVANTPEKQQRYLEVAYQKACDMEKLLQRLFYFSKMETTSLPFFPQSIDLWEFMERFTKDTAAELETKNGGTIVLQGEHKPHMVSIDPEQFLRVFNNFKENAIRYAEAPQLKLTISLWRQGDFECIRFQDNGNGVKEEDLPHLFEQFWRGDASRNMRKGEGSGLGLYIVKYIVEAHGGRICAKNDGGLVFDIALPCEEVSNEQNTDRGR